MPSSKAFCFIPAKQGSTRVKEKNIRPLAGKPLIGWSIDAARGSQCFDDDDIILSSESDAVQALGQRFGAATPYTRPAHLAKDPYGVKHVLHDFLLSLPQYQLYTYGVVILPTCPFIAPEDIRGGLETLERSQAEGLLSVTVFDHSPFRAMRLGNEDRLQPLFPQHIQKKSQELPPAYRINGGLVIVRVANFLESVDFFPQNLAHWVMPAERSVDIDHEADFQYAEFLTTQHGT